MWLVRLYDSWLLREDAEQTGFLRAKHSPGPTTSPHCVGPGKSPISPDKRREGGRLPTPQWAGRTGSKELVAAIFAHYHNHYRYPNTGASQTGLCTCTTWCLVKMEILI